LDQLIDRAACETHGSRLHSKTRGRLWDVAGDDGGADAEQHHKHHPDDDDAAGTRTAAAEQAHADATKEARRLVGRVPPAALIERDRQRSRGLASVSEIWQYLASSISIYLALAIRT